jgi:hypothetical protein
MSKSTKYDKLPVSDLKKMLSDYGMVGSGDKGTLIWRLNLYDLCEKKNLKYDNKNPCTLKGKPLTSAACKVGVSPIGSNDEIMKEFVDYLEKNPPIQKSNNDNNSEDNNNNSNGNDQALTIARKILELGENDDHEAILNLGNKSGTEKITRQTPLNVMRKAYLKLSLVIHPDKIGRIFEGATRSFQALVKAFERLSSPEIVDDVADNNGSKNKTKTLSRSNENCYRTRACCPRCKRQWSEGTLDGNPDYFYNFLMTGIKQFSCSTCLCYFGCMTAIHKCPHCYGTFEYSPEDYHRKLKCNKPKCGKTFGFYMFPASDRILTTVRQELKQEQEKNSKERDQKKRRLERANRNQVKSNEEDVFLLGLSDICPRCGEGLEHYGEEEQRNHLMECTDKKKHAQYNNEKNLKKQKIEKLEQKKDTQEEAQRQAVWQFLGSNTSSLWLLEDNDLRNQAKQMNLDTSGDKDELIARIASEKQNDVENNGDFSKYGGSNKKSKINSNLLLENKGGNKNNINSNNNNNGQLILSNGKRRLSLDNLPSNIHSMEANQLRSVCAANGLLNEDSKKYKYKHEYLDLIESHIYEPGSTPTVNKVVIDSDDDDNYVDVVDLSED